MGLRHRFSGIPVRTIQRYNKQQSSVISVLSNENQQPVEFAGKERNE
jgi:hypothetical protein